MARLNQYEGLPVVVLSPHPCESPENEEQTRRLIVQAGRGRRLIIDLSEVASFNARLLGTLASAFTRMDAQPGEVALCIPSPIHRELFEITHLDRLFFLHGSLADAARSLLPDPEPMLVKAG
jgi:anti-anti-sigma factor